MAQLLYPPAFYTADLLSFRFLSNNIKIKICRNINLSCSVYGCGTWSLTSREQHGLRVSENSVLRNVCGPKMEEVTGGWSKLHKDKLHDL